MKAGHQLKYGEGEKNVSSNSYFVYLFPSFCVAFTVCVINNVIIMYTLCVYIMCVHALDNDVNNISFAFVNNILHIIEVKYR